MTDRIPDGTPKTTESPSKNPSMDRRAALVRLGLATGALYAAPALAVLKDAKAGGAGKGKGGDDPGDPGSLPG